MIPARTPCFAVAKRGQTGDSFAVMGMSVWYFVRPRPDELRAVSTREADRFLSDAGGRIVPDTDGLVRYTQVCVDFENRRAIALVRVDFLQARANKDGSIDRDHLREVMHVVPVVMSGVLPSDSPAGVVDAEPKFAKRRLDHLTRWTPTNDELAELRRLVNDKAGRDIM